MINLGQKQMKSVILSHISIIQHIPYPECISQYLYQLSSTGAYMLVDSKINYTEPFGGPTIGPGYVKLQLNLSSINSPSGYGILF